MKIAIDARGINWYRGTGIGTYTENLLRNLIKTDNKNNYQIYWAGENYEDFSLKNTEIIFASNKHHSFFEEYYFPTNLLKDNISLYHVPQNGIGLCEKISCKKVVTIHDLIPYIMPETVGKGYLLKFLSEMPKIIQSADAIITVSNYSKQDILRFFPVDPGKIYVTPLAADLKYKPLNKMECKSFLGKNYNIKNDFVLYIGGFSPRKNVKTLILAFSKIYKDLPNNVSLVIVGAIGKDQGSYLSELGANLDVADRIIFTGYVHEDDLPIFYNGCEVFVYPSVYEGFGLPPLEAMSCGTPVITSNLTSIPEVVGDAGILINPYNEDEMQQALAKVFYKNDLRENLIEMGIKQSKTFNWQATSQNTLQIYESILSDEL